MQCLTWNISFVNISLTHSSLVDKGEMGKKTILPIFLLQLSMFLKF